MRMSTVTTTSRTFITATTKFFGILFSIRDCRSSNESDIAVSLSFFYSTKLDNSEISPHCDHPSS